MLSNLGACETLVVDLRRSNLIERGRLDQVVEDFLKKQPRAEPALLADYLVNQGILSKFQAERVLKGKPLDMVLGPYVLMDVLGAGGMGTVYKAKNKNDNKWYAVKVLPRRSMWNVLIARRQARAYEQCKHPSVVPFLDVGTAGGAHYLVWPLVEGESLDHVVQKKGKLPPGLAAHYLQQVAAGMGVCHRQGLVHGMIKPSNLMIGPKQQVFILDYGIGSLMAASEGESMIDTQSMANAQASGLDCVSPESILEPTNLTPAGDQYSLGCVLYLCLTGRYPFPEETAVAKMQAHQTKQPTPVRELAPKVPEALALVANRLLQKSPADRFANAEEIVEALQPLADTSAAAEPAPVPAPPALVLPTRQSLRGGPSPAASPLPEPPRPTPPAPRQRVPPEPAPPPRPPQPPLHEQAAPSRPEPARVARPESSKGVPQQPTFSEARPSQTQGVPPAAPARPEPAHAGQPAARDSAEDATPVPASRLARSQEEDLSITPIARPEPTAPPSVSPLHLGGRDSGGAQEPVRTPQPPSSAAIKRRLDPKTLQFLFEAALFTTSPKRALLEWLVDSIHERLPFPLHRPDRVHCTVFAPPAAARGTTFHVHVFAHRPEQARMARKLLALAQNASQGGVSSLATTLERGTLLCFQLELGDLTVATAVQSVTWQGWPETVPFPVQVPAGHDLGPVTGRVTVSHESVAIGRIEFQIAVVAGERMDLEDPVPVGTVL